MGYLYVHATYVCIVCSSCYADLGEAVLNVLGCLVPFLMQDLLDSLPFTVASTLVIFPSTLHKDTIDLLCTSLLPMTLGRYIITFLCLHRP